MLGQFVEKCVNCNCDSWECLHGWRWPRSSKPVEGVNNALSGFDSHTLPLECCRNAKTLEKQGISERSQNQVGPKTDTKPDTPYTPRPTRVLTFSLLTGGHPVEFRQLCLALAGFLFPDFQLLLPRQVLDLTLQVSADASVVGIGNVVDAMSNVLL